MRPVAWPMRPANVPYSRWCSGYGIGLYGCPMCREVAGWWATSLPFGRGMEEWVQWPISIIAYFLEKNPLLRGIYYNLSPSNSPKLHQNNQLISQEIPSPGPILRVRTASLHPEEAHTIPIWSVGFCAAVPAVVGADPGKCHSRFFLPYRIFFNSGYRCLQGINSCLPAIICLSSRSINSCI